ncbi:MAG: F0F1 ATP synthase subunit epsilon [Saccharofermentans sp.]|nr:F0F1 ATP synthase subunit epsilon [Saccharofermentans sp.]
MREYQLKVMSPDGEVFNDKVIALSLRGAEGDLAVFGGHVPFVTTVKPGKCVVTLPNEEELEGQIKTGILNVGTDSVTLLVGDKDLFKKK